METKELPYFTVGSAYGGRQAWLQNYMMRLGGCGAVTACDSCIYLQRYCSFSGLYPYNAEQVERADYLRFSNLMKPYLRPRWQGIDTLELYIDGFRQYLTEHSHPELTLLPLHGTMPWNAAAQKVQAQIDSDFPIPCLMLKHRSPAFRDYEWHWFLLTGYSVYEDTVLVKAVTYGSWRWLNLQELWNTGHQRRGGLVLFQ